MKDEVNVSGARPGYKIPSGKGGPVPPEPSKVPLTEQERRTFEAWGIKPDKDWGGHGKKAGNEKV
jgi:hypothetical protein